MLVMSTDTTLQIASHNLNDTLRLGEQIGRQCKGGEVIELVSDLGGGKTTLMRGVAKGLGSTDHVASPTFTVSREYRAGKLRLHHYDFYRLTDPGIVADELAESVADPQTIVAVEWADVVESVLPADRLTITIETTAESERALRLSAGSGHVHLIKELQ